MSRFLSVVVLAALFCAAQSGIVVSPNDPDQPGGLARRVPAYDAAQFSGKDVVLFAPGKPSTLLSVLALSYARVGALVHVETVKATKVCDEISKDAAVVANLGACYNETMEKDSYVEMLKVFQKFKTPIFAIVNLPEADSIAAMAAESNYRANCGKTCFDSARPAVVHFYTAPSSAPADVAAEAAMKIGLVRHAVANGLRATPVRVDDAEDENEALQASETALFLSTEEARQIEGDVFSRHWSYY